MDEMNEEEEEYLDRDFSSLRTDIKLWLTVRRWLRSVEESIQENPNSTTNLRMSLDGKYIYTFRYQRDCIVSRTSLIPAHVLRDSGITFGSEEERAILLQAILMGELCL